MLQYQELFATMLDAGVFSSQNKEVEFRITLRKPGEQPPWHVESSMVWLVLLHPVLIWPGGQDLEHTKHPPLLLSGWYLPTGQEEHESSEALSILLV
jgi:hypothetical protein